VTSSCSARDHGPDLRITATDTGHNYQLGARRIARRRTSGTIRAGPKASKTVRRPAFRAPATSRSGQSPTIHPPSSRRAPQRSAAAPNIRRSGLAAKPSSSAPTSRFHGAGIGSAAAGVSAGFLPGRSTETATIAAAIPPKTPTRAVVAVAWTNAIFASRAN
jgi:hypothetical protein